MDVKEPTASEDAKSEAFPSNTKRTFVLGVVNTTGMKSVNMSRKRRWDQPPDEDDTVPAKVVVREEEGVFTQPEPDQASGVCETDQNVEDYDSQYDECVNANNVVPTISLDDPIPEDGTTMHVCDFEGPTSKSSHEEKIDSKLESRGKPSIVDTEPPNLPPPPVLEVRTGLTNKTDGVIDSFDSVSNSKKDTVAGCESVKNEVAKSEEDPNVKLEVKKAIELEKDAKTDIDFEEKEVAVPEKKPTPAEKFDEKKVGKPVAAIPVILSDSLKQIQFCYDEDSNSTEGSEEEAKVEEHKSEESKMVVNIIDRQSEQEFIVDPVTNPEVKQGLEASEDRRRSPTPVLPEELDENSLSEAPIDQIAKVEVKSDISNIPTKTDEEVDEGKLAITESKCEREQSTADVPELNMGKNLVSSISAAGGVEKTEPNEQSQLEEVQIERVESDQNELFDEQIPNYDVKTISPTRSSTEVSPKVLEDSASPSIFTGEVIHGEENFGNDISLQASESCQPNDDTSSQGERLGVDAAGKEAKQSDGSNNDKPFTDSMDCNSELSLSKDMFMEESSAKSSVIPSKMLSKEGDKVGHNNLVSMDNSQNCVGFGDLNEKATSKSPELELRFSDSEEDSNKAPPEVTMHFASFRTPEYVPDHIAEKEIEDESIMAMDALSENPDLSGKAVELPEPASSDTMEMLDSLVRRSSEDDPSRIKLEGMLSEDSLINEINQLPDEDDKKMGLDKTEDSLQPVVERTTSDSKKILESTSPVAVEAVDDEPMKSQSIERIVEAPCENISKDCVKRDTEKSEPGVPVEDDLSQGVEEEPKNVDVSSEKILEVIFGSEQDSNVHTIRSMDSDVDSKVTPKIKKDGKHVDDSSSIDFEPKTGSLQEKSADDSKLQLNNEEIENDDTEIVMVDPTKPLSGEDTDNDVDDGCSDKEKPSNKKTAEVSSTVSSKTDVAISQSDSSLKSTEPSENNQKVEPMVDDLVGDSVMEVEESDSSNNQGIETTVAETEVLESMDVNEKTEDIVSKDNIIKTKKDTKGALISEASHSREPAVPVLIIKKQALPSKKDGDKRTVETLLTCSPKSTDLVSDSAATPPRKLPTESIQIDTAQEPRAGSYSPKHSPITLRIYKDNLTVKTDLDSPKRNKSPMSSEFKSELSPKMRSPSVSENLSPQNKQLEFTLKIAKDVHTNYPKATMSPKNVASPTSVWKSEVQLADSPSVPNKNVEEVLQVKALPSRGRGRGRGRGATPKRGGFGRGRRGASQGRIGSNSDETPPSTTENPEASSSSVGLDIIIKQEVLTEDEKSQGSSVGAPATIQMHDMFKKMMSKETEKSTTPESNARSEVQTPRAVEAVTPVARKRGRPRKSIQTPIVVPEEVVIVKQEPSTPVETTPSVIDSGEADDGSSSGRPKRTCRGRTKPIVIKKRKPRGGGAAGAGVPRGGGAAGVPRCGSAAGVPRGGGVAGAGVPRGASTPLPSVEIKEEDASTTPVVTPAPVVTTPPESTPIPIVTPSPPVDSTSTPLARGRGGFKRPTPDRNTLSEKELAELQKIEAKKEKLRLDRIAKYEAKKAKKLAKKLKDEERRKRLAREKAEKAEAAAPQVFEEETRMSAPDSSSRGQTPALHRILTGDTILDESQNSISTPGDTNKGNKKGRMEISITDMDCLVKEVRVDELAEYQWQGSELYMIQEQVSLYLGVKSFKRKYPGLKRRPVEAEERTFLEDSGLVPKSMCDLGLTAVGSAEILDIMFQDFPEKYEEFRKHVRDKQAREASFKQRAAIGLQRKDGTKVEPREQALEAVAAWNANLNRERREERRCALDLQTFTVHYPKLDRENMKRPVPRVGLYPVAVIPGQFCDHYKKYTPNELMYFPVNTVLYGPLRPNERQRDGSDDGSESSSSSSSSSSSGESSSESESEGDDPARCKMCSGTKKKNKDSIPEVLLTCVQCKSCYHPTCKEFTPEMIVHLTKYEWQCTACKKCSKCRDHNLKDRIMCCQLCDRGYHLSCIGLKKMPEGRWHCTVCAYCSSCGSRNPGGSDWQHEFKKGEKGIKIYQRTLCTPCFKLWRKGKYCQLCSKCHVMKPEEDPNLIQCNSCDRWLHKECYGSKYGLTNKLMSTSSIQCDFCVEKITMGTQGLNRSLIKV